MTWFPCNLLVSTPKWLLAYQMNRWRGMETNGVPIRMFGPRLVDAALQPPTYRGPPRRSGRVSLVPPNHGTSRFIAADGPITCNFAVPIRWMATAALSIRSFIDSWIIHVNELEVCGSVCGKSFCVLVWGRPTFMRFTTHSYSSGLSLPNSPAKRET